MKSQQQEKKNEREEIQQNILKNIDRYIDRSLDQFMQDEEYNIGVDSGSGILGQGIDSKILSEKESNNYLDAIKSYVNLNPQKLLGNQSPNHIKEVDHVNYRKIFQESLLNKNQTPEKRFTRTMTSLLNQSKNTYDWQTNQKHKTIISKIYQQNLNQTNTQSINLEEMNQTQNQNSNIQRSLSQSFLLKTLDNSKKETQILLEYNKFKSNQSGKRTNPFVSNVILNKTNKLTRQQYQDSQCYKMLKEKLDSTQIDFEKSKIIKEQLVDYQISNKIESKDYLKQSIDNEIERIIAIKQLNSDFPNSPLKKPKNQHIVKQADITIFKDEGDQDSDPESRQNRNEPETKYEWQTINSARSKQTLYSQGTFTERVSMNNQYFKNFVNQHEKNYLNSIQKMKKNGTSLLFQKNLKEFLSDQNQQGTNHSLKRSLVLLEPIQTPNQYGKRRAANKTNNNTDLMLK
eukprot:403359069